MKVGEFTKLHRKSGGMGHPQSEFFRSLFNPCSTSFPGWPNDPMLPYDRLDLTVLAR
jgi:hypothetical protein